MTIIGYGEDGLTYRALTTQLQLILTALEGDSVPENCTAFFRPSFGRAGGPSSAQFGEFDAILATKQAVYLIESKWDHGTRRIQPDVVLDEVQITRHRIFTWLRKRWRVYWLGERWLDSYYTNWDNFCKDTRDDFRAAFPYRPLAVYPQLLARNLAYILRHLDGNGFGEQTRDVLLYFRRESAGVSQPNRIVDVAGNVLDGFALVCLPYAALGDSGYFQMHNENCCQQP